MTEAEKRAVWDVLVEECGAHPDLWDEFVYHWPECREFRFQGTLGFGGKVWRATSAGQSTRVDCYPEDVTPARTAAIERANARFADLGAAS